VVRNQRRRDGMADRHRSRRRPSRAGRADRGDRRACDRPACGSGSDRGRPRRRAGRREPRNRHVRPHGDLGGQLRVGRPGRCGGRVSRARRRGHHGRRPDLHRPRRHHPRILRLLRAAGMDAGLVQRPRRNRCRSRRRGLVRDARRHRSGAHDRRFQPLRQAAPGPADRRQPCRTRIGRGRVDSLRRSRRGCACAGRPHLRALGQDKALPEMGFTLGVLPN
jgi:hypothetical protein